MTFDLPRDREAFSSHSTWDFTLTHEGEDFQASMQEVEGLSEEEELPFFKRTVMAVLDRKGEALQAAADHLLADLNELWNEGAPPISREEFIRRLRLATVSIGRDGRADMDFLDDDMFLGHIVVVSFDRDGSIIEADIAG